MPSIDVNKKKPICPYCKETIDRFGSTLKAGRKGYEILFCLECGSFLAVIPEGQDVYEPKGTMDIIREKG
jgi:hypothetical protein